MTCDNCGKEQQGRGGKLCSTCYSAQWRKDNPELALAAQKRNAERKARKRLEQGMKVQRKQAPTCTHESGCDEKPEARDLCSKHYRQWWREENRERRREYNREWRRNNPEKVRALRGRHKKKTSGKPRKQSRPKVSLKKPPPANESVSDYMRRIREEFGIAS
jgi:hypothetical protein